MALKGDPGSIHGSATAAYGAAQHAGGQANYVQMALSAIPPIVEVGPAADQMRAFGGQLQTAMQGVSVAYDKVSAMLHRVAGAVEEAQQAERAADKARQQLAQAKARLAADQATEKAAQATVTDASHPLTPGVSPLGPVGPTAAQTAALTFAKHAVTADEHAVQADEAAYKSAQHHFQVANQHREALMRSLIALCDSEAVITTREIPNPPANFVDIAAVDQLRQEAGSLLDLPFLAKSGFAITHSRQVTSALGHLDSSQLNAWTAQEVARLYPAPKPKPQHHGGGGFLSFNLPLIGHVDPVSAVGDVISATNPTFALLRAIHFNPVHFVEGIGVGTKNLIVGLPTGIADLARLSWEWTKYRLNPVGPKPPDPFAIIVEHPIAFGKALIGYDGFGKDPSMAAGQLVPTLASFLVDGELEKGVSAANDLKATAAAGATEKLAAARVGYRLADGSTAPAQTLARIRAIAAGYEAQAPALRDLAAAAEERATLLEHISLTSGIWDKGSQVASGFSAVDNAANDRSDDPFIWDLGISYGLPLATR